MTLSNIGAAHEELKELDKALECYTESLKISRPIGDQSQTALTLHNMGVIYRDRGDGRAETCYRQALSLQRELGQSANISLSLSNLGELLVLAGDSQEAQRCYDEGLQLAESVDDKDLQQVLYRNLAALHARQNDFRRAYEDHVKYADIRESLVNRANSEKIAEMQEKYESEKRGREIAVLQKNAEIQQLRLSRERWKTDVLIASLIMALAAGSLLVKRYFHLLAFWKKRSFVGHYRKVEQIGSGGMGVVYRAYHLLDKDRPVALKVIRDEHSQDPAVRKRFLHEALIIDQLNHPNIVKVLERGEHDQTLFLVMEYLEGRSLADRIAEEKRMTLPDVLSVLSQLLDALQKIHGKGIVHRDLKPENVMREAPGARLYRRASTACVAGQCA